MTTPNGAQALIQTLVNAEVDVCFTNPGTSEMHFVAALDQVPEIRGVLGLFEGVVTGAADGYGRIAGKPAATLLHLGPGLGNGFANLHNARRARTPMVNIVGDHATYHKQYDAPLESDIDSLAHAIPGWYRRSMASTAVAQDTADAVAAARSAPGQIATLVLPADTCWSPAPGGAVDPVAPVGPSAVAGGDIDRIAQLLRSDAPCALLVGGRAMTADALRSAGRIAAATGAKLLSETFPARHERGAGIPAPERLIYLAEFARMQLTDIEHLILIDAMSPVAFFAYPEMPSTIPPDTCTPVSLAEPGQDPVAALAQLAEALGATELPAASDQTRPDRPSGPLDPSSLAAAVGATLPDNAIVVDESNTSGLALGGATANGPRHDWLTLTGGSIGIGLPLATGAAIAAPDRRVLALQADGSAMYTLQALWTMAREQLDVTVVLANNGRYAVLDMELNRVGAASGEKARAMFDLTGPDLDFSALAAGHGVSASRAETAEDLTAQLEESYATPGPHLIDAVIPPMG